MLVDDQQSVPVSLQLLLARSGDHALAVSHPPVKPAELLMIVQKFVETFP